MRKRQIKIYISILFFLFINIITYANSFIFTNNLNYNEKTNIILNISNDKKWSSAFYKMSSINIQKNENTQKIKISIGKNEIIANLYDNNSTKELLNILEEGAITLSASNYGGFEKVCKLPKSISSKDTQIKAEAGDIMLYNNNQIVFFYGTNTWAYTRLGKVVDENIDSLKNILSGNDTSLVIELVKEEKNRTFGKK